jgi:phospholipase/carboxylesterase
MTTDSYTYVKDGAARDGAPLIFTFHGTGGDEQQFMPLAKALLPDATIISPRGDVSEYGHLRFFKRKAEGVYDFDDLDLRSAKMAAFVRAHKAQSTPSRIIGLGYSNGANILASVAFRDADLFDDLVLMHPLIPWAPEDNVGLKGKRVLITAGERDQICPPPMTQALEDYFMRQGSDVTTEWHVGGHDIRSSELDAVARFLKG